MTATDCRPVPISSVLCEIEREPSRPPYIRIIAGGRVYAVPMTTPAVGPQPGGGEMHADLSRFKSGDSVRIIGVEGCDYRATIA
jgi:hypothetical protein